MRQLRFNRLPLLLAVVILIIPLIVACAGEPEPAAPPESNAPTEETAPEAPAEEETGEEPTEESAEAQTGEEDSAQGSGDSDLANLSPDIPDPSEPVEISFASWVGDTEAMQQFAEKFHELHPNITVQFQTIPFEEIRTKLLTQVAANNPPDVAFMDASTTADFASRGALVNLDSYIEKSNAVVPDDYVEAFLNSAIYEGSIYGLPFDAETTALFYRTDRFEEAGISSPPATWEEFQAAAEALTQPDEGKYGVAMFAPEAAYYWYPWFWQAGGTLLSDDGQDILFNSPEGIKAAEFYTGLTKYAPPDYLNSNSWDGRVAFAEGTVGMYVAGAWFAGTLMGEFPDIEGKWNTAPLPEDQKCATTIAGDNLVVFAGGKNQDAAWKWVEFLSAPENMALWNLGTEESPSTLLPPRKSLLEDESIFEHNQVLKGFAEAMSCAQANQIVQPKWPEVESVLNEKLGAAMYGELDPAAALEQAEVEGEEILKE